MITILGFIQSYGYASIFFFTLLEGEVVVALAGFVASEGYLYLPYVILTAIVGAIIGDHAYFFFGRYKGKHFIESRPKLRARAHRIHRLIERHQDWLIFGSRFMYGFRTILPIAIGTSNVKWTRFSLLNSLGSIVWGFFFAFRRISLWKCNPAGAWSHPSLGKVHCYRGAHWCGNRPGNRVFTDEESHCVLRKKRHDSRRKNNFRF